MEPDTEIELERRWNGNGGQDDVARRLDPRPYGGVAVCWCVIVVVGRITTTAIIIIEQCLPCGL